MKAQAGRLEEHIRQIADPPTWVDAIKAADTKAVEELVAVVLDDIGLAHAILSQILVVC